MKIENKQTWQWGYFPFALNNKAHLFIRHHGTFGHSACGQFEYLAGFKNGNSKNGKCKTCLKKERKYFMTAGTC